MTENARQLVPNTAAADVPAALMPYQQRWIADTANLKVMEKGRRTGITWAEAADDVLIAASAKGAGGQNVYYLGTDKEMTEEYIQACAMWAKAFNYAAGLVEEGFWDEEEDDKHIKTFTIRFPESGFKITALASRPRKLRGRQGVLVGDEAAFVDDLQELLKAAVAFLVWGGKVRLISTHDGHDNAFNELIEEIRAGGRRGSIHRVPFREAVEEGLYRRVCMRLGKTWSQEAEEEFIAEVYGTYGDAAAEELDCIPSQGSGAWLSAALIEARMTDAPVLRYTCPNGFEQQSDHVRWEAVQTWLDDEVGPHLDKLDPDLQSVYGQDFGRSGDLSVMVPAQITQTLKRKAPFILELRNMPHRQQEQVAKYVIHRLPRFVKAAVDARGNGHALAEFLAQEFGYSRVELVMATEGWYREHMPPVKKAFEDDTISLPRDKDTMADLRVVRVIKGVARVPERTTGRDGGQRHGDSAIAVALMYYASRHPGAEMDWTPVPRSVRGFDSVASHGHERPEDHDFNLPEPQAW
ncbi:hypothetical protein [Stenotrophomonas sp. NY11291]|uniref:hypothetical protein n=1 Tax=Stenotrophomonas sp. NY11291 TaxID=2939415 RepID=UPI00200CC881|nr:hypothetical protein [Stenotrophomonas sp. NY11291]UQA21827.1 hypothetical protein M1L61_18935 [Stenotrophomonas sp. NY11291]